MVVKILVTGSRTYHDKTCITNILSKIVKKNKDAILLHGACKGADLLTNDVAIKLGIATQSFPANWNKYGNAAGPIRNQEMVNNRPDIVLVFHESMQTFLKSKGTLGCVKMLNKEIDDDYEPIIYFNGERANISDLII